MHDPSVTAVLGQTPAANLRLQVPRRKGIPPHLRADRVKHTGLSSGDDFAVERSERDQRNCGAKCWTRCGAAGLEEEEATTTSAFPAQPAGVSWSFSGNQRDLAVASNKLEARLR